MEKSTITLTRRIQLLIDLPSNEQKEMCETLPVSEPLFPGG